MSIRKDPNEDVDARALHRRLIESVNEMEGSESAVENLGRLLRSLVDDTHIPIIGGRIWVRSSDEYRIIDRHGGRKEIPSSYRIRADEGVIRRVVSEGTAFIRPDDPEYNEALERDLGVQDYAAIAFGDDGQYVLSLDVTSTSFEHHEDIIGILQILRHVTNRRLEADHFEWIVREARDIQTSILPKEMPSYRDYDIHGCSLAADKERVGGDLFDFISVDEENLAVVVADASGHGLPSALMARDIRTAVHMAIIGEIKPTRMIKRVNQIVCEQAPLGRFVSLFYGEIDRLNQMIYTVAGHPGLHVAEDGVRELREGGPVLGIHPGARYGRGVVRIEPGEIICVHTDGLNEARDRHGEIFGEERIDEILKASRSESAEVIVNRLLDAVRDFSYGTQEDDQTVVVVKRNA